MRRPSGRGSSYYRTQIIANDLCVYCGEPAASTDHIHPTSQGGFNSWVNFAPTCVKCNCAKGSISLLGFLLNRSGRCSKQNASKIKGAHIADVGEMPELWFDPLGVFVRDKESLYAFARI